MNFYASLFPQLAAMNQERWSEQLQTTLAESLLLERYGDKPCWLSALQSMPELRPSRNALQDNVTIGSGADLDQVTREELVWCKEKYRGRVYIFQI